SSDDAGGAGDHGDPAIQTNSIGHKLRFPQATPVFPDFVVRGGYTEFDRTRLFHLGRRLTSGPRAI
ncbi:MAG TPA: hypothetical protein VKB96_14260, partial [Gammaproteobacteria bacterium]|nr:hypothetical protein [Gammaproteobacteria bacterium]